MGKSGLKTIGQLGRQFGISRSSLIYYDKIGLIKPSARSEANYRLYTKRGQRAKSTKSPDFTGSN